MASCSAIDAQAPELDDLVELHGLLAAKELNGRWGRIVAFVEESSRYGVKVDGVEEPKSIKAANLRKVKDRSPNTYDSTLMPAAFMESVPGTPMFRVLLRLLPAKALQALTCCQKSLRDEVESTDEAWEKAIGEAFGGDFASARQRCPKSTSPASAFAGLAALRRAVGTVDVVRGALEEAASLGVEAVVCPANSTLRAYGLAARAVFAKAGQGLHEYMEQMPAPLEPGAACWTPAFGLGTKGIVHAVGPDRNTIDGDRKLHQTYSAALQKVLEHGHKSVAMGSISTGGNGFHPDLGAAVAVEEIRATFSRLAPGECLRIVIVAFEEDVETAFRNSLAKILRRVNEDILEIIPLMVLDSMLPGQHLTFDVENAPVAINADVDRFGMVGKSRTPHGLTPMKDGVEVSVINRSSVGGSIHLEVVAGRRFSITGMPHHEDAVTDQRGRHHIVASVAWAVDEHEEPTQSDLGLSTALKRLVNDWLALVRAGRERQPGQMDLILGHLGPMPPARELTKRAMWVCALINPLPSLGVAYEIRPAVLKASSGKARLEVATEAINCSIAHLNGTSPLF